MVRRQCSGSSGTAASRHGNNGAPVTDAKHIYAAAGGHEGASLVCLEKATGKLVWKSGNDYAAYAGLMLGKLAGVEQVVYVTAANMKGYRAVDGKELWSVPVKTGRPQYRDADSSRRHSYRGQSHRRHLSSAYTQQRRRPDSGAGLEQ